MTDQENLSADQRLLMGHVLQTESALGGPGIEVDEQGNAAEPKPDLGNAAEENKAILATLIAILTPAMPFLPQVYTPEVIDRIANAYTAVEDKYGWNVRGMMGVEVQLAIVAIPPTVQAIVLGRLYFEEKRRRENERDITPPEGGAPDGSQQ